MKRFTLATILLLVAGKPAFAGSAEGNGALSLAALVAEFSPTLPIPERRLLLKYLDGDAMPPLASAKKINVASSAIACRISDVDITRHSCELRFGSKKVSVNGRKAHELYAILIEIGASPEGAAGSIIATVANLDCSIDPGEIRRMAGGGAHCAYDAAK